jgi:hypothetical protein
MLFEIDDKGKDDLGDLAVIFPYMFYYNDVIILNGGGGS